MLNSNTVYAVTLLDAIKQTFKNNTELNVERENIKFPKDLNISKGLPSIINDCRSKSNEETNKLTNQGGGDASISDVDPFTTSTA